MNLRLVLHLALYLREPCTCQQIFQNWFAELFSQPSKKLWFWYYGNICLWLYRVKYWIRCARILLIKLPKQPKVVSFILIIFSKANASITLGHLCIYRSHKGTFFNLVLMFDDVLPCMDVVCHKEANQYRIWTPAAQRLLRKSNAKWTVSKSCDHIYLFMRYVFPQGVRFWTPLICSSFDNSRVENRDDCNWR